MEALDAPGSSVDHIGGARITLPETQIAFVAGFLFLAGSFLVFLSLKVRGNEKNMLKIIDHDYL